MIALTKRRRMRSSSRLSTAVERRLDPVGDLTLARLALLGRDVEARIEARGEQAHEIGGDRRVLAQRRPHIALGIGHAGFAAESARWCGSAPPRATSAPPPARARCSRRSRRRRASPPGRPPRDGACWRRDRPRGRRRARASCRETRRRACASPASCCALRDLASDLIGALVDDLEAHVLEHGDALRERDRPVVAPNLQADAAVCIGGVSMKVDAERAARRQPFDDADVADAR